ncbi:acyl-CoA carboxylase epsilon subunit [Arthrobacter sp. NEB 688]|uniref:acyl-CoA carboxylase epsilon subunit n=1 Tax=Arthrobacter sp. NEB 688 TaxID=904039 RepID=UPI001563D775|nr:acyl-CoA carboxylase epsilon subunit [Arthrobacter sp. NEB 688]QKE85566.1 acyl-CoA carboxylase subunit epsilon [Arthrobacter sp. NEB 688]
MAASPSSPETAQAADAPPAIVVHGPATAEDVAAVVAVLAAAGAGEQPAPTGRTSTWAAHDAAVRRPVGHGPGAWHTAFRR